MGAGKGSARVYRPSAGRSANIFRRKQLTERTSADDPTKKPDGGKAQQIADILVKRKRRRTLWFETDSQKRELFINLVLFGVVAVLFGLSYCSWDLNLKIFYAFAGLILLLLSTVSSFASLTVILWRAKKKGLLSLTVQDIEDEHQIICDLIENNELVRSDLDNFKDTLDLEAKHLRSRIGTLVGDLEKIGMIPAFIALSVAFFAFCKWSGDVNYYSIYWATLVLVMLYVQAAVFLASARTLERHVRILQRAAQSKNDVSQSPSP